MINHLQPAGLQAPHIRPFTPAQAAQHAITEGDHEELRFLVEQHHVHAATRTANGETLLMFATRQADPGAFNALAPSLQPHRVNEVDQQGNTVLHYLALHLTNRTMQGGAWADGLDDFLNTLAADIDWEQENHQGSTAPELATALRRTRLLNVLSAFIPDDTDSDVSEPTDNSAGDLLNEAHDRFMSRKRGRGG